MESIFFIWTMIIFLNRSSDFCPRMAKMAKMGVCKFVIGCILLDKITSM
jgi:hypothetical protein